MNGETVATRRFSTKALIWAAICSGLLLVLMANAHLVYVAVESEPGCVPHATEAGGPGTFQAAKSAC